MTGTTATARGGASDAMPPLTIRVIRNPAAGIASALTPGGGSASAIQELLDRHGIAAEVLEPEDEAAAHAAVRQAVADGIDVVVAAGGDGTVHLVVAGLVGTETALGILPLGRVMNIARSLGIDRDLDVAADILGSGHVLSMDVGEATTVDGRTVRFLEAGSVGMNAAIFRQVARIDAGDVPSILRTMWVALRYRPARMTIELDDEVVRTRALMVSVSIGPYLGLAMTVAPEARLDDGRFDVHVFRHFSKLELLRHLASIAFGRRRYAPQVSSYRSSSVRISSVRPLPARADSFDLGSTPVVFRTLAGALRVVAPKAYARFGGEGTRGGDAQAAGGGSSGSASGRRRM
jgi:diacylglycerol kinase (ATP)